MTPGDFARFRFDWDTGRHVREPVQATEGVMVLGKVLLWILAILIAMPAIYVGGFFLFCLIALAGAS